MSELTNEKSKDDKKSPESKNVLGSMVKPSKDEGEKKQADSERDKESAGEEQGHNVKKEAKDPKGKKKELTGVHEERVNHIVTFDLTEDDFAKKGKEAAKIQGEMNDLEREFNCVKEEFKAKTSLLEGDCNAIMSTIRRGKEEREVTCTKLVDFDRGVVEFWFLNKIVETRGIKPEERQGKMF